MLSIVADLKWFYERFSAYTHPNLHKFNILWGIMIESKLIPRFRSLWCHQRPGKFTTALGLRPRAVVSFPGRWWHHNDLNLGINSYNHTMIDWMLLNFTPVIQQNCHQLGPKFEKSFWAVDRLSCQLELSKSETSQFRSDLVFDIVNYVHVIFLHGG